MIASTAPGEAPGPNVDDRVDQGMREQLRRFQAGLQAGCPRVGWKIGITTAAARRPHGLSAPVIGWLDGRRTFASGDAVPLSSVAKVRAEGELAMYLDRPIGAESSLVEVRKAIAMVGPAIEFIDLNMPKDDIAVILGHSIFHDAVIFGPRWPVTVLDHNQSVLPVGRRNGKCVRTPEPAMIPPDLAALVMLVARTLARYGESLEAGDRIISGSYIVPLVVEPGDVIEVDFGFLGKVSANTAVMCAPV